MFHPAAVEITVSRAAVLHRASGAFSLTPVCCCLQATVTPSASNAVAGAPSQGYQKGKSGLKEHHLQALGTLGAIMIFASTDATTSTLVSPSPVPSSSQASPCEQYASAGSTIFSRPS